MTDTELPAFPAKVYYFDKDGKYNRDSVDIANNLEELTKLKAKIRDHAFNKKLEVRITDPYDFCTFHAQNGKIIFPKIGGNNGR